jgi:hypothetical protein
VKARFLRLVPEAVIVPTSPSSLFRALCSTKVRRTPLRGVKALAIEADCWARPGRFALLTKELCGNDGIARASLSTKNKLPSAWACFSRCQADCYAFKLYLRVNLIIGTLVRISTTLFKNTNGKKRRKHTLRRSSDAMAAKSSHNELRSSSPAIDRMSLA